MKGPIILPADEWDATRDALEAELRRHDWGERDEHGYVPAHDQLAVPVTGDLLDTLSLIWSNMAAGGKVVLCREGDEG